MPRLWFAQLESILAPQKQGDEAKFNLVVAKVGREVLQQVSDLLLQPPETNKYQALKERLLQVYEESAERLFQKLVSEMELGTQKPSQLLRRMKELGRNAQTSEQNLRNLWISRLPTAVRTVLTVSHDQNLENLARIADKIMENIAVGEVAAVSSSTGGSEPIIEIMSQMRKLNLEVASLRKEVQEHRRSVFRGHGRGRGFSRHRSTGRSRSRKPGDENWLCNWHYKYRKWARKCEQPCVWKQHEKNHLEN
ncbi:unnamed protein product [Pieris brassicae]|uniref:DUF7041 domain-containing protein n=1 Tax=Pieris brassicae TaxID=7116 RepID=A0A9P0XDE8_PIEBR|nr:unnamed protein product [Pieris brassicae]